MRVTQIEQLPGAGSGVSPPVGWDHRLVDVGGRRLHVALAGAGSPTVVFDHGLGTSAESWGRVPADVAARTRVFVYDRAGLGRSDPAPRPRSAQDIVNDLRAALAGADVLPPYVLVGHSFGGLTVRLYASQHPTDVAGIVMVDGTNELQYARYLALVPAEERDDWRRRYEGENAEGVKLEESAAQVRAAAPLPLVPLVVVTAGRPPGPMPDSSVDVLRLQRVRSELQEELATRVPSGRQVIAERSGHFVQQDQPDLVVEVVLSVVEQTRRSWRRDRGGDGAASASDELPSKHQ